MVQPKPSAHVIQSHPGQPDSTRRRDQVQMAPQEATRRFRQNMLFRLVNEQQANNCFVNVVIQNLWHVRGFQYVLKDVILEGPRLQEHHGIVFYLARLLKEIKESNEGSVHSVSALKTAILSDMYGAGSFEWNE